MTMTRAITGAAPVALGAAVLFGATTWPAGRATAIGLGLLAIVAGLATLRSSILLTVAAIWAAGGVALAGGIAAGRWVPILAGAVTVVAGLVAFATNNYATWFGVAALSDAVALGAVAFWASGTGGSLPAVGTAGLALGALTLGATTLAARYR